MIGQPIVPFAQQIEFDTDVLCHALTIVAQADVPGRYQGEISLEDGGTRSFVLIVDEGPGETQATIDVSVDWQTPPTFNLGKGGYVVVAVGSGNGGQKIRIWNTEGGILDNTALKEGQIVAFRLYRPGTHVVRDVSSGATCTVTVQYPSNDTPMPTDPVKVKIKEKKMSPDACDIGPLQPIVITVAKESHLTTELTSTLDRNKAGKIVSSRVAHPGKH